MWGVPPYPPPPHPSIQLTPPQHSSSKNKKMKNFFIFCRGVLVWCELFRTLKKRPRGRLSGARKPEFGAEKKSVGAKLFFLFFIICIIMFICIVMEVLAFWRTLRSSGRREASRMRYLLRCGPASRRPTHPPHLRWG
jgi:hypothetical protein